MHQRTPSHRVVIGHAHPQAQQTLRHTLLALGHTVVGVAASAETLSELCRAEAPDLVVLDLALPGATGLVTTVCDSHPVPVIVVAEAGQDLPPEFLSAAPNAVAYLTGPATAELLGPAAALAVAQFTRLGGLLEEVARLRQELADRKVIERAKGAVMTWLRLEEAEAFRGMRTLASTRGVRLVALAEEIVAADAVFRELDEVGEPRRERECGPNGGRRYWGRDGRADNRPRHRAAPPSQGDR